MICSGPDSGGHRGAIREIVSHGWPVDDARIGGVGIGVVSLRFRFGRAALSLARASRSRPLGRARDAKQYPL